MIKNWFAITNVLKFHFPLPDFKILYNKNVIIIYSYFIIIILTCSEQATGKYSLKYLQNLDLWFKAMQAIINLFNEHAFYRM